MHQQSVAATLIFAFSVCGPAQADTAGTVLGVVRPDGLSRGAAHTRIVLTGDAYRQETSSDAHGRYIFFGAPPGRYVISFPESVNYPTVINVHAGVIHRCDFFIMPPGTIDDIYKLPSDDPATCPSSSP